MFICDGLQLYLMLSPNCLASIFFPLISGFPVRYNVAILFLLPAWSNKTETIRGYAMFAVLFCQQWRLALVATERNAKLRYEGYKKLSEM